MGPLELAVGCFLSAMLLKIIRDTQEYWRDYDEEEETRD